MAIFFLKQYNRVGPVPEAGLLVKEWAIDAETQGEAASIAQSHLLNDFQPSEDFALLFDERGKIVGNWAHHD